MAMLAPPAAFIITPRLLRYNSPHRMQCAMLEEL